MVEISIKGMILGHYWPKNHPPLLKGKEASIEKVERK